MNIFFLMLAVYVLALLGIGWWFGRGESEEDYLIAGRDRPWWQVAFSKYAVTAGAAWFVTYTAFAYEYGLSVLTMIVGMMIGYGIFAFWGAKRIKKASDESGGFYTMGDLVKARTNSVHSEGLLNSVVLLTAFLYLTIGVVAGSVLMEEFNLVSYEFAVFLTFIITIGYVLMSGYKAVVLTDVLQGIIMMVLLAVVAWSFVDSTEMSLQDAAGSRSIDMLTVIMFAVFGAAATFASPDRYQLSYAGKNIKAITKGFMAAAVPVFLTAVFLLLIGTLMYEIDPTLNSSAVFPKALTEFLPAAIAPFALVMFFAALMSSVDTNLYVLASHLKTKATEKLTKSVTRKRIVVIGFGSALAALMFRDVVDLTIFVAGVQTAIAFPMIYLVAGGRSKVRFLYTIYGGLLGIFAGLYVYGLDPRAAALVLVGNVLGLAASYLAEKKVVNN